MLLTVSGAFLRSFQKMRAVDPGFLPDHVLVAEYQLPLKQYSTDASADSFNRAVVDGLSSRSGIIAVGITNALPASGFSGEAAYTTEGEPADIWKLKFARFATIYGDYFRAMSIPLLDGRPFTMDDRSHTQLVVVVNQSMARHSWPGQRAEPAEGTAMGNCRRCRRRIPRSALAMSSVPTSGIARRSSPPSFTVLSPQESSRILLVDTSLSVQPFPPRK